MKELSHEQRFAEWEKIMYYVLIALLCNSVSAWTSKCVPTEIAVFANKEDCLEAAKKYSGFSSPVCGVKEAK